MASKSAYAKAANGFGLMVAELDGVCMGIGTRAELEALIADEMLPAGTIIREAVSGDF